MTTEKRGVVILRGNGETTESAPAKQLDLAGFQAFAAAVARLENTAVQRMHEAPGPRPVAVSSLETLRAVPDAPKDDRPVEDDEPGATIARFPGTAKASAAKPEE